MADSLTSPVGGWRYVQPQSGLWFNAGSGPDLTEQVVKHRKYKGYFPQEYNAVFVEIQEQICKSLTNGECRPYPGEKYEPTADLARNITTDKAIGFSKTVFEAVKQGAFVEKNVSEERAATCRSCYLNRQTGSCACSPFYAIIEALVPAKRSEPGINICAACGCTLKAKVLLPMDAVHAGNEGRNINFPDFCWQKK